MPGPLEGIRVIELAVWHVGPPIGYILGDLGAEVIKVERPDGGDTTRTMSPFWFEAINRSKKSVALDLKQPQGREVLYRLVEKSDVFSTNFPDSLLSRLGADYEAVAAHNQRLVYASVSAFGHLGPQRENRAYEALIQARTGFSVGLSGGLTSEPRVIEGGLFDQTTGTVMVYGILAALVARERTGKGQKVEGSLLGSAIHFQHGAVNYALWRDHPDLSLPPGEGSPLDPHGDRAEAVNPLYNWYQCSDGRWVMFCEPDSDRFWGEFCRCIGAPELIEDPRYADSAARSANRRRLIAVLDQIFARKSLSQWIQTFEDSGMTLAHSPVNATEELSDDIQALENQYITEIEHPRKGRLKTAGIPLRFSGTPASVSSAAPELGQHSDRVLSEVAGLSEGEIAKLRNEGVLQ
ncbi:MAG: CaiB/BaiF CoA transferase family protein [Dehalococcoidia bacterium]